MAMQLVIRRGCHLCEKAAEALERAGIEFDSVDVDADAELFRLYDFRVPVLLRDGRPVMEGRIGAGQLGLLD